MTTRKIRSKRLNRLKPIVAGLAIALSTLPVTHAFAASNVPSVTYPAYSGPKKTIAVSKFDAVGSFVGRYGGWDIGGGLAAMLTAELARTNRFVVLERGDLDTLLREKQMALTDVTRGASGGALLGARTFIHGSVTEFDERTNGGGLNLGLSLGSLTGGLGGRQATGHIAIDLRLIDGETGAVLATSHVEKRIHSNSVALQGQAGLVSFGGDRFNQTSLGRASREAIEDAVGQIIAGMERVPFEALVARVDGSRVFINAGSNANILPGTHMRVTRMVDSVVDPQTGETLGGSRATIADVLIDRVEDRFAIGSVVMARGPVEPTDVAQLINP